MRLIYLLLPFICIYAFSKPIDINLKNLNINELIEIASEINGVAIMNTYELNQKVDFYSNSKLDKSKLLNILDLSLQANGYKLNSKEGIYFVSKKLQESKMVKKTKAVKPKLDTKIIKIKNFDVLKLKKIISNNMKSYDKNFKIEASEKLNLLIITSNKEVLKRVEKVITQLDKEKVQVFVKASFIELNNKLVNEFGFRYGLFGLNNSSDFISLFSTKLNSGQNISSLASNLNLNITNLTSNLALGATITLLNKTGVASIISQPSILALNNQTSSIYVGETVSIKTSSKLSDGGAKSENFKREDVGLSLKVKPRVINENRVILDIKAVSEDLKDLDNTTGSAITTKKEVKTVSIVSNGEPIVLGGLIQNKKESVNEKVPGLGDVPMLGELFKNRYNLTSGKSLILVVTPYIIPKNRDVTFIREELSKLDLLKNKYVQSMTIKADDKRLKSTNSHQKRVNEILGYN